MHRHFLTFRRNTRVVKKLPDNYLDKIQEFLCYNIQLRHKSNYELHTMTNINETPIYLNIPTSITMQTIGSRKANIRAQGQENWRITVI